MRGCKCGKGDSEYKGSWNVSGKGFFFLWLWCLFVMGTWMLQ